MIARVVRERLDEGLRPLVVHSAVAGVSNQLSAILESAPDGGGEDLVDAVIDRHRALARELGVDADALLEAHFRELKSLVEGMRLVHEASPAVHARTMALGELMATTLGAAHLRSLGLDVHWLDAREALRAEEVQGRSERAGFLSATCGFRPDSALQARLDDLEDVVLTQGFIARDARGDTVLLGRGGSDTSAAYLAARLEAARCEIWTDVPGMFSADPRIVPGARLLKALRYEEAQEIASTGGSVLHPRSISPLRHSAIPLWVKDTARPDAPGTVITAEAGDDAPRVKALSRRRGITLVSMETFGMWQQVGFLAEAFRCFAELGLSIDLVSTSEGTVTVTLDPTANAMDERMLERLTGDLERLCRVTVVPDVAVVSLVGQKVRALLPQIGPALEVFQEHRIHLLSQAASDLNLSFVVDAEQADRLVQNLHALLINPPRADAVFGGTWQELAAPAEPPAGPPPWWIAKRKQLLDIAMEHAAAYVYDRATVTAAAERLRSLRSVDRVFYSIKANAHADVLRAVLDAGLGLEAVSEGELRHVLAVFPGIDRARVLFTPNFAPRSEYSYALEQGVAVTLDNLHPLRHWGGLFDGTGVLLRLDPGQGRGHHQHVRTAGSRSKFGIAASELEEAAELVGACGTRVVGLHAHTGSGILAPDNWEVVARALNEARRFFPDVRVLDLGGGLGIPEKAGQQVLDLDALDASLARVRELATGCELWLEPGRYVVAEAGVLLATVTQVKGKGAVRYVGVATGMNSLIRPALYGAYHEIVNLTRAGEPATEIVNVVGPICESGDKLGNDRLLPPTREGDVLLIANAGAYGRVMSSHYNRREPAGEFVLS